MASTLGYKCAHCHKHASRQCVACKDSPSIDKRTESSWCCTTKCQKADWDAYKDLCRSLKERRDLCRAGDLLQDIFYLYREKLFDRLIDQIELRDGKSYIQEGHYAPHLTEYNSLVPFPESLCQDPLDMKALLVHLSYDHAVAWMANITKHILDSIYNPQIILQPILTFLTDISSEITEFAIKCKNSKRELVPVDVNGKENPIYFTHRFFRVTLKHSGDVYALDLSGAQYGYYDPVAPFETYLKNRARAIVVPEYRYLGRNRDAPVEHFSEPGSIPSTILMNLLIYPYLLLELLNWEKESKIPVHRILTYSQEQFILERQKLLGRLARVLDEVGHRVKEMHLEFEARLAAGENMEAFRLPSSSE